MSETLRLLKFDPAVALLIMANHQLRIRLHIAYTDLGLPEALDANGLTKVRIITKPSTDPVIRRDYTGELDYEYQRIHVGDVFGNAVLDLTPPLTVAALIRNIALTTGLAVSDTDFVNELIEGSSFTLKANANSLRWYGETTVMLNEPGVTIQLAEAFPNNVLDGLIAPVFTG